ncbi:hypothetical protein WT34_24460 [Burkholderia stagnalis]|uniref:hypothetical protein n=1 Tax=Burkholderia stagnalis TaxID=1503054 RepID=UPI000753E5D8|nr:hypothetical protein [Burkholderia stagnalis]KVX69130.1 hypothetical protein WT34_24460 [Burkholderia stagnalis]
MNGTFFVNKDTLNPVVFYLASAEELNAYNLFFVDEAPRSKPHGTVIAYSVVGKRKDADRLEIIAEFPNELYAQIFRDMAERSAQ